MDMFEDYHNVSCLVGHERGVAVEQWLFRPFLEDEMTYEQQKHSGLDYVGSRYDD